MRRLDNSITSFLIRDAMDKNLPKIAPKTDPLQSYYAALYAVGYAPDLLKDNDGIKRCPDCGKRIRYSGSIHCPDCR